MNEKLIARIQSPGTKKILALDGGGIRGMVTVEVLAEIESQLRQKTGPGNAFQLADYFDFKMAPCSNRSLRYSDN
jgi:patatin-like phospholipase/acyl hydrolase